MTPGHQNAEIFPGVIKTPERAPASAEFITPVNRGDGRAGAGTDGTSTAGSLDRAVEDYLTFLRVERGLSPATIRAYRADLADFAAARGSGREWADGPDAAVRYLAARTRRGRPNDPGLAPTSLRRR